MSRYCMTVNRYLRDSEYKYSQKLARLFKELVHLGSAANNKFARYRKVLDKKMPHRSAFLKAMNEVFTLQQAVSFDDYIYDLENYGKGLKFSIKKETRKLIDNVIIDNINKLSEWDIDDLHKKLKNAIKEYNQYDSTDVDDSLKDLVAKKLALDKMFEFFKMN